MVYTGRKTQRLVLGDTTVTRKYHRSLLLLYQQQSLVGEGHSGGVGGHVARRCWHHLVLLGVRRGRRLGAAARQSRQEGALLRTPRTAGVVVQSGGRPVLAPEGDCALARLSHDASARDQPAEALAVGEGVARADGAPGAATREWARQSLLGARPRTPLH